MIDKRKFYINGTWVNPIIKNDFEVINPSNEQPYALISLGCKEDVDLTVNVAKKAFITWCQVDKNEKIIFNGIVWLIDEIEFSGESITIGLG